MNLSLSQTYNLVCLFLYRLPILCELLVLTQQMTLTPTIKPNRLLAMAVVWLWRARKNRKKVMKLYACKGGVFCLQKIQALYRILIEWTGLAKSEILPCLFYQSMLILISNHQYGTELPTNTDFSIITL